MNLYLACGSSQSVTNIFPSVRQPPKILCSYHYFKRTDMRALMDSFPVRPMLFADSGAFSAKSVGADIVLDDYIAWLRKWKDLWTVYVNLDVIGDAEGTWRNQQMMEGAGMRPMPVFHGGEPFEYLDRYAATHEYVALGGMAGAPAGVIKWCATVMHRHPHLRLHGFGQTRREVISELPWYSVDSSSWGKGHRYGRLEVWTGRGFTTVRNGEPVRDMAARTAIRSLGVDPVVFEDRTKYHQNYAIRVSSWSWQQWELALQRRHGRVPAPPGQPCDGLNLYLAEGGANNIAAIYDRSSDV